jgi:hypothetical protein
MIPVRDIFITVVLRTMMKYFKLNKIPSNWCKFTRSGRMKTRPDFLIAPVGKESSASYIRLHGGFPAYW